MPEKQEKRKCKHCGKSLVAIGKERENGKPTLYKDWATRAYHKKCYKDLGSKLVNEILCKEIEKKTLVL
jgi:hypothetical protein